jgi:hypothetical protein
MYDEKHKQAIMKWRDSHKDNYLDYQASYMRDVFYKKNADQIKTKRMGRYYLEKELKTFRHILL